MLFRSVAPRRVWLGQITVSPGCTVGEALNQAQAWAQAGVAADQAWALGWSVGVWGRKASPEQVLRDGDRVELVRPLLVDPKEARRVRYRAQGEKLPKGYHRPKGVAPGSSA